MINLSVLKKPVVSEKSSLNMEKGIYTFQVATNATKVGVKQAFEKLFGEKVKDVRMINIRKKTRIIGKGKEMTRRSAGKKAIITLKENKKVDVFQSKSSK